MAEVEYLPGIGQLLADLLEKYNKGELVGIVIGVKDREGFCNSYWSGLTYLERLGLATNLQTAIYTVKREEG